MNNLIFSKLNYAYEGTTHNNEPHGYGTFFYQNNDKYVGECMFGKKDGFGRYYYAKPVSNRINNTHSSASYTGFFSCDKMNGIGTYEDDNNIYKGIWRNDKKCGKFYRTNKRINKTYLQEWKNDKLINNKNIQYIQPDALQTTKENPKKKPRQFQTIYKGVEKRCIGCYDQYTNAVNITCGHVIMCYTCLNKCETCPICRVSNDKIIKLYSS